MTLPHILSLAFMAGCGCLALALLIPDVCKLGERLAEALRAPSGDRLSPLRGQAPAGLASPSINPSRGEK